MLKRAAALCLAWGLLLSGLSGVAGSGSASAQRSLESANAATVPLRRLLPHDQPLSPLLGLDDRLWNAAGQRGDRDSLLSAIDYSLRYLETPAARDAYANYPVSGITRQRVRRSLRRFRQLLLTSPTTEALQAAVLREFDLYQAVGNDNAGTVHFTGYFEPSYSASRSPTPEYRYPLYRRPPDLEQWTMPHPTRLELEGADGLQSSSGRLRGLELVWLRDRLEAFLVQVQGSARLQLTDGSTMTVGYAGRTEYPYQSVGRMLVEDGKIPEDGLRLPAVLDYFRQNPSDLDRYLPGNNRFVFFRETEGAPPLGTLNVPVTAERSIATDKSLMPPGAIALLHTTLPFFQPSPLPGARSETPPEVEMRRVSRYVLDQDTGGAILGAGRADIFMGTGDEAGDRAGLVNTTGQLYYLLIRE